MAGPTTLHLQGGRTAALQVAGLSKSYAGTRALSDLDLSIHRGEVLALCGANGSGKSTLIKLLAGVERPDPGASLTIGGQSFDLAHYSPAQARAAGLRFVHQDAGVFEGLTVAENFAATQGYPRGPMGNIRWRHLKSSTSEVLERFEIDARPEDLISSLSPAVRMTVAIARALQDVVASSILVLDEPTASLPKHEVDVLLQAIRRHADQGQTILYVSHRLDEVLALADRLAVLRDGSLVHDVSAAGVDESELVHMLVGRDLVEMPTTLVDRRQSEVVLDIANLAVGPVVDASIRVHRGEVVGIAGLLGSGRTEILQTLFGARSPRGGSVTLGDGLCSFRSPRDAIRAGFAYVPEDRIESAAFSPMSIAENLSIPRVHDYSSMGWVDKRLERRDARTTVADFSIKTASTDLPLSSLSGGNQQKVIVARWLTMRPRVLLLDEPSQGVDVGSRSEIFALLGAAVADGAAALVVSSDFEELIQVCDRIVVLAHGHIVADLPSSAVDSQTLSALSLGTEHAPIPQETLQ